jgi:hypothetical protein
MSTSTPLMSTAPIRPVTMITAKKVSRPRIERSFGGFGGRG